MIQAAFLEVAPSIQAVFLEVAPLIQAVFLEVAPLIQSLRKMKKHCSNKESRTAPSATSNQRYSTAGLCPFKQAAREKQPNSFL